MVVRLNGMLKRLKEQSSLVNTTRHYQCTVTITKQFLKQKAFFSGNVMIS